MIMPPVTRRCLNQTEVVVIGGIIRIKLGLGTRDQLIGIDLEDEFIIAISGGIIAIILPEEIEIDPYRISRNGVLAGIDGRCAKWPDTVIPDITNRRSVRAAIAITRPEKSSPRRPTAGRHRRG